MLENVRKNLEIFLKHSWDISWKITGNVPGNFLDIAQNISGQFPENPTIFFFVFFKVSAHIEIGVVLILVKFEGFLVIARNPPDGF